jgi:xylitol oxidase
MTATMTNWAGNVSFRASHLHRPASVSQLQLAVARSGRIRALGTGHSFSPVADTTGDLISVAGLPPLIDVDAAAGTVTVSAGLRYGEVAGPLQAEGRALANLGSLPHISVAGACATGTHGSGVGNGCLATAVRALQMVGADGDLITLARGDDDFPAAVVALGALGVVTRLTLDTVPSFDVRQQVYEGIGFDQLAAHFDEIVSAAYSVSLFTTWREPVIQQAWLKRRADDPRLPGTLGSDEVPPVWMGGTLADGPRHPVPGMPAGNCTDQLGVAGPWHQRLPHFRLDFTPSAGEELQTEYLVPRSAARDALSALEALAALLAPVVQISEFRTVARDDLWLSPAYEQDCAAFHFTWIKDEAAVAPAVAAVEEALAPLGARPHWGKVFGMSGGAVRGRYPRADDFRQLMRRYDPAGKFRNDFLDVYLPPWP